MAVNLLPGQPGALLALGNVLHDRAHYAGAAELYGQVLAAEPDNVGALTSLGNTLQILGRMSEALAVQDRAAALAPNEPEIRFNRAVAYLAAGDYARGWEEYEFRWRRSRARPRDIGPLWDGGCVAGRTVLLHAEQGLGDTLQFIRYANLVRERGAHVVLEVQAELVRLVRHSMPFAVVVARGEALPHFDVHCPLLSVPRLMGTCLETVPACLPYLRCDPERAASWGRRLPDRRPLIGLVWAGGNHMTDAGAHLIDQRRSLRPADLAPLAEMACVQWISLQKGREERPFPMIELMDEVEDFADTAELAANLDLVVAVDTSVAHLAAAMGCPVWLLSRYDGCWRWLHGRDDSPWYPGMRIYRQERPLDWSGVLLRIRSDLEAEFASRFRSAFPGESSATVSAR